MTTIFLLTIIRSPFPDGSPKLMLSGSKIIIIVVAVLSSRFIHNPTLVLTKLASFGVVLDNWSMVDSAVLTVV